MQFLVGMTAMGFLLAAVFFVRFWRRTQDMLFLIFSGAFCLLALNQVLIGLYASRDDQSLLYLPRLAAFGLLIAGIAFKNWNTNRSGKA